MMGSVAAGAGRMEAEGPANDGEMFGLIGKLLAVDGSRDELMSILLGAASEMPGCLAYVVARDVVDSNAIWVTEVWSREEAHRDSLKLPAVKDAIARARPLIAGFGERFTTQPVGGHRLGKIRRRSP